MLDQAQRMICMWKRGLWSNDLRQDDSEKEINEYRASDLDLSPIHL